MPKALDLPVEPITGRPRFVTERQPLVFGGQLSHQLGGGRRRVVELAQKPNLVAPTAIRDCNRITQLCGIECHESFAMIAHDSPSLFEALPTIRATLALTSRVSRLSKGRGIRSEMLKLSISHRLLLPIADAGAWNAFPSSRAPARLRADYPWAEARELNRLSFCSHFQT